MVADGTIPPMLQGCGAGMRLVEIKMSWSSQLGLLDDLASGVDEI